MTQRFKVIVPASSGNIGPGFDVTGLALSLRNELIVSVLSQPGLLIHVEGEGESAVSRGQSNLVYQSIKTIFKARKKEVPPLELTCINRIPLARGLGSSSAAILSGLLAGNRLLGEPYSKDDILKFATDIEGHPDNVAPSLFGGVQACAVRGNSVLRVQWPSPQCRLVVAIPDFELSTKKARAVLPQSISMKDAIWNLSSVSLLPMALSKKTEWLKLLLADRWHEPYRAHLVRGFNEVKAAALKAGAFGVTLSGAGPTILAFVSNEQCAKVSRAMSAAFERKSVHPRVVELKLDMKGAFVR